MRLSRSLCFLTVLTCVLTPPAVGQSAPDIRYGHQLYVEAAQLPSDSAGKARVDIFLRVTHDFMIFTRTESLHADSLYAAGVEISMHARREGKSVATRNHFASLYSGSYEATEMRDRYLRFRQHFHLEPGRYEFLVTLSDRKSARQRNITRILEVKDLQDGRAIGMPLPLEVNQNPQSVEYSVLGYDGTLPFAAPGLIGIPVTRGWNPTWTLRLLRLDEDGDVDREVLPADVIQPEAVLRNVAPLLPSGRVDNFDLGKGTSTESDLVVLRLPIARLDVGPYLLQVRAQGDDSDDSLSWRTSIYWRNMPYSLRDIEFAVDVMRYILTEDEYEAMSSGSRREMTQRFREYWRELDTTPETEYNEMMTEYFRRVDETIDQFQTLHERNGAQTDRGKVYILFGPPEDKQRVLNSDEPAEEIWYYPSLGKTFRFVDRNHNGDYKLYEECQDAPTDSDFHR
ncbi:MAG: GWxTD domain-containing protein [Bacteroidota bacterium]|nr:GWxTD domain-containing protein [Bacteroidota bacterium]